MLGNNLMDDEFYIIAGAKSHDIMTYSDAVVIPVNKLEADDQEALDAGATLVGLDISFIGNIGIALQQVVLFFIKL